MTLRDILPKAPVENIMVRANAPEHIGGDMLLGYCAWDGNRLVSLDGDSYCLDDEVVRYEFGDCGLVYWTTVEWI